MGQLGAVGGQSFVETRVVLSKFTLQTTKISHMKICLIMYQLIRF